jgi:diadenosine tetraphosphate (Ap4A) HIT family hydrolase
VSSFAPDCPFCDRIQRGEVDYVYRDVHEDVVRFAPLNPVSPGHMLFLPMRHAEHRDSSAVAVAMGWAENWAAGFAHDFNLITSSGPAATQTIPHVHIHYVPRHEGDGLPLPWTGQRELEVEYGWRKYPDIPPVPVDDEWMARRLAGGRGDVWQRGVTPWRPADQEAQR